VVHAMGRVGVVLALIVSVGAIGAAEPTRGSSRTLHLWLGESIEIGEAGRPEVRYCPDNTCEVFRLPEQASREVLSDFALVYLWFVSDYSHLQELRQGQWASTVESVVSRHATGCEKVPAGSGHQKVVRCVLETLASRHRITVHFGRHDEGTYGETEIGLSAMGRLQ
jgi:hypothetical protein